MATPPKPPAKPPKSGVATPAPRRSTRKASTVKPATSRAPAKAPAPGAAKSDTAEKKVAAPKAAPQSTATKPRAKAATTRTAKVPTNAVPAKPPAAVKQAAAALPTVDRNTAWSIGAIALAVGAGLTAFLTRGRIGALLSGDAKEGHVPTDLLDPERNKDDRAIADFRPDMDAVMTAAEREALRPATGSAPTLAADRGTMSGQTGPHA